MAENESHEKGNDGSPVEIKRLVMQINVGNIEMDRYPLNPTTLDLIKFLEAGGTVPPIKIAKQVTGRFKIRDGRHRLTAFKLLGRKTIEAKFSTKPMVA